MKNGSNFSWRSLIFFSITAFILSFVLYHNIFHTFYQQDEWMALGQFFAHGPIGSLYGMSWSQLLIGLGRPLIIPLHILFYRVLPFQIWPLALFSVLIHPMVGIALFAVVLALTGSIFGAWAAGMFFLLSYNGSQAVSWFATSTVTLASSLFGLISVLLLLTYIKNKKALYLVLAEVFVVCSYFFKESGFMFVLFLPFLYMLWAGGKGIVRRTIGIFSPLIVYFSLAIVLVIVRLLTPVAGTGKFVGQSSGGIWKIIQNALIYPVLSFSQSFIPFPLVKKISPALAEMSGATDAIFLSISVVLLIIVGVSVYFLKHDRKPIVLALVFMLFSFVPYAVLERGASYLSLRYFYAGMAGAAMLVGVYAGICWQKITSVSRCLQIILCGISLIFAAGCFYKNVQFIGRDVQLQVLDARERLVILRKIKRLYPVLPKNPVFYVTGDHPGYYFVKNQKMPFQQGIGYTLLVWYYQDGGVSRELLLNAEGKFWDISGQGYIELNGKGFGYYWDKEAMEKDVHDHKITKDQIVGFYYHSGSRDLEDISIKIQNEMP